MPTASSPAPSPPGSGADSSTARSVNEAGNTLRWRSRACSAGRAAGSSSRSPSPWWCGAPRRSAARPAAPGGRRAGGSARPGRTGAAGRRQLQRQGDVVQAAAQLDHRRVGRVPGAAGSAARARSTNRAGPSSCSRPSGHTCSPATPSGSRLVARIRAMSPPASMRSTSRAACSSTCSQLSSTSSTGRAARWSATSSIVSAAVPSTPAASATARVMSAPGGTGLRSTNTAPSAWSAWRRPATASATVVLPMPPGPATVTRGESRTTLDHAGDVPVAADRGIAQARRAGRPRRTRC